MNKLGIWVIAIAFAFVLGTIFSADIATATKPITEVFLTNTDPIPVQVTNNPETASPSSHPAVQFEVNGVQISSCTVGELSSFSVRTLEDGLVRYSSSAIPATIHSVVVTEDAFELEGIYTSLKSCIDDLRNFPALFSITGDCGLDSTVTVRTEGGVDTSFTANVACIS